MPKPHHRGSISIVFAQRDGNILLLQKRSDTPEWDKKWELPGGKIEAGEDPENAMHREFLEETGLSLYNLFLLAEHDYRWDLKEKIVDVHIHLFAGNIGEGEPCIETEKAYQYAFVTPDEFPSYDSLPANRELFDTFYLPHARSQHMGRN